MLNHNTTMNRNNINHGDYVSVTEDLSPGKTGFVVDTQGDGFHRTFTVRYDESASDGGKTEPNIGHSRITGIPMPYGSKKQCHESIETQQFSCDNKDNTLNHMTASRAHIKGM